MEGFDLIGSGSEGHDQSDLNVSNNEASMRVIDPSKLNNSSIYQDVLKKEVSHDQFVSETSSKIVKKDELEDSMLSAQEK